MRGVTQAIYSVPYHKSLWGGRNPTNTCNGLVEKAILCHIWNYLCQQFSWHGFRMEFPTLEKGRQEIGEVFDQSHCMILMREAVCAVSSKMSFLSCGCCAIITSDKKSRWATMLNTKQIHNTNERWDGSRKDKWYTEKTNWQLITYVGFYLNPMYASWSKN